jgi:hypothetical protein
MQGQPMPPHYEPLEAEAVKVHTAHGLDPTRTHQSLQIIAALGIEISETDRPMPGGARLGVGRRIWIQRGLGERKAFFDLSHELAAYLLRAEGYVGPDLEAMENRLGAALLAPRPSIVAALRSSPWRGVRELARQLDVSDTFAALRLGEATGDPIAVVNPDGVRLRGSAWPLPETPLELAKCRKMPSGTFRFSLARGVVVGVR